MTLRILALTKYGPRAASTRQRIMIYESSLREAGIEIDYRPLLGDAHVAGLSQGRRTPLRNIVRAYATRARTLLGARQYDLLWIHYELFPWLPWIERAAAWTGRPYVVDYDDATFHTYDSARRGLVRQVLGRKLIPLLRAAAAVVCGNGYLQAYAAPNAKRTLVVPTVVDTDRYRPRTAIRPSGDPLVIGWIGSPSTWSQVQPLLPMLDRLCRAEGVRFLAVGAGAPAANDRFDWLDHRDWTESGEISDVQSMDIGIMPLLDKPFIRGKCGYKLIQYMACGLPVVAAPVGVNAEIVIEGEQGFIAISDDEWAVALRRLIRNPALRERMGHAGRRRAVDRYSLASQAPRLVALLRDVAGLTGG